MKRQFTLLISLVLLLLASCEKFEEGGTHAASARHIRGKWGYESVMRNGIAVGDSLFGERYRNSHIEFERGSIAHLRWSDAGGNLIEDITATYVFNYNRKVLCLVTDTYPLQEMQLYVKRLTDSELWMEYIEDESVKYRISMIKLEK